MEDTGGAGVKLPASLISIKDVLGVSEPAKRLIDAIERGIGELTYPWRQRRRAATDIEVASRWSDFLHRENLSAESAELVLQDRAILRLSNDLSRFQKNRELIAAQAVQDFASERPEDVNGDAIEDDWLDRYWRLAEKVSNRQFQSLWGRILSRHARGKHSFSPRCLESLSLLTPHEAHTLERLAPMVSGMLSASGETRY